MAQRVEGGAAEEPPRSREDSGYIIGEIIDINGGLYM
jgi:hypothetical protein